VQIYFEPSDSRRAQNVIPWGPVTGEFMRAKQPELTNSGDLFRSRLDQIINMKHERSDLTHWRKRIGEKLDKLLAENLRVAHATGALKTKDMARVSVDTTVQPKDITFPTDAKLLHTAIKV
jgi:hypothetical protein